ncbi:hypothetical protein BGP_3960 [Beggiatoa sp. PS]|nr:hypothetical protein BGP_3960 [Beggiatoa sp. PS]
MTIFQVKFFVDPFEEADEMALSEEGLQLAIIAKLTMRMIFFRRVN